MQIDFARYTLTKKWTGAQGFINFLQAFANGQLIFIPEDFPEQRDQMASNNITHLTLTYRYTGADTLLRSQQQPQAVINQVKAIDEQLKNINDRLTAMDAQEAADTTGGTAQGSAAGRGLAALPPPAQVAYYWFDAPLVVLDTPIKVPPE